MAAGREKKQSDGVCISGNSLQELSGDKKKNHSELSRWLQRMHPHIALEWDEKQNKAVAQKGQVGVSWRHYSSFYQPSKKSLQMVLADVINIPEELFSLKDFSKVFSYEVWQRCLSESEKRLLLEFLPEEVNADMLLQSLFRGDNFHFGSPLLTWESSLCSGDLHPDSVYSKEMIQATSKRAYYSELQHYHSNMLKSLERWKETWQNCKHADREFLQRLSTCAKDKVPKQNGVCSVKERAHSKHYSQKSAENGHPLMKKELYESSNDSKLREAPGSRATHEKLIMGNRLRASSELSAHKSSDSDDWDQPIRLKVNRKFHKNFKAHSSGENDAEPLGEAYGDSETVVAHSINSFDLDKKRAMDYWMQMVINDIKVCQLKFLEVKDKSAELRKMLFKEVLERKKMIVDEGSDQENSLNEKEIVPSEDETSFQEKEISLHEKEIVASEDITSLQEKEISLQEKEILASEDETDSFVTNASSEKGSEAVKTVSFEPSPVAEPTLSGKMTTSVEPDNSEIEVARISSEVEGQHCDTIQPEIATNDYELPCKPNDPRHRDIVPDQGISKEEHSTVEMSDLSWKDAVNTPDISLQMNSCKMQAKSVQAMDNDRYSDTEFSKKRNVDSSFATDFQTTERERPDMLVSQKKQLHDGVGTTDGQCVGVLGKKRSLSWTSVEETCRGNPLKDEDAGKLENGKKPCFKLCGSPRISEPHNSSAMDQVANSNSHSMSEASEEVVDMARETQLLHLNNQSLGLEAARDLEMGINRESEMGINRESEMGINRGSELLHPNLPQPGLEATRDLEPNLFCSDARTLSLGMDDRFAHASDLSLRQPHSPDKSGYHFTLVAETPEQQRYENVPTSSFLNHLPSEAAAGVSQIQPKTPMQNVNLEIRQIGCHNSSFSTGLIDAQALQGFQHQHNGVAQELQFLTDNKLASHQAQLPDPMLRGKNGEQLNGTIQKQQILDEGQHFRNQPYLFHHSQPTQPIPPHSSQQDVYNSGLSQAMGNSWSSFLQVPQSRALAGPLMQQYDPHPHSNPHTHPQHGHGQWNGDCHFQQPQSGWCPDFSQRPSSMAGQSPASTNFFAQLPDWSSRTNQPSHGLQNHHRFGIMNSHPSQMQVEWAPSSSLPPSFSYHPQDAAAPMYRAGGGGGGGHMSWMNMHPDPYANSQMNLRQQNPGLSDFTAHAPLKSPWNL